jgi:hypothetical protein
MGGFGFPGGNFFGAPLACADCRRLDKGSDGHTQIPYFGLLRYLGVGKERQLFALFLVVGSLLGLAVSAIAYGHTFRGWGMFAPTGGLTKGHQRREVQTAYTLYCAASAFL